MHLYVHNVNALMFNNVKVCALALDQHTPKNAIRLKLHQRKTMLDYNSFVYYRIFGPITGFI